VGDNSAAQVGSKAADQQEHAVVKTVFDPFFVTLHELAGLAPAVCKFEEYHEHSGFLLLRFAIQHANPFYVARTSKRIH
jgi:hypothetical protein